MSPPHEEKNSVYNESIDNYLAVMQLMDLRFYFTDCRIP